MTTQVTVSTAGMFKVPVTLVSPDGSTRIVVIVNGNESPDGTKTEIFDLWEGYTIEIGAETLVNPAGGIEA